MVRSLYAKLSLSLVVLLLCVGLFYTLVSFTTARYSLQQTAQKLNLDLAKNIVADRKLVKDGQIDTTAIGKTFMEYMVINPSIEIYLLDLQGKILSYSADPGKVKRYAVSLTPIHAFLNKKRLPLLGDDPRSHDRKKIFSVTPVPSEEKPEGYLYIVLQGELYDDAERLIYHNLFWKQTGLTLGLSLLLSLMIGLLLFKHITKRVEKLSFNMERFRSHDFGTYDQAWNVVSGDDEIDRLAKTFSKMAQRIVTQLGDLKQQDELRRELVANVSHDLRTPITILHGYLETLELKSKALSAEQQQHFLQQALLSSERLSRLVNELFELASLESVDRVLKAEQVNVTELVHDIVQKFQIEAENKGIHFMVRLPKSTVMILGDIALIERVVENLLSNAFKFTPDGGDIVLAVNETLESVELKVEDTGVGIHEKDIERVFDRFYQGEHEQSRVNPGGLGLAISKRVVELHGGTLDVESVQGEGASFIAVLPKETLK